MGKYVHIIWKIHHMENTSYGNYIIWKNTSHHFGHSREPEWCGISWDYIKQFEHYFTLRRLWQQFHQERLTRKGRCIEFPVVSKIPVSQSRYLQLEKGLVRFFKAAFFREMLAFLNLKLLLNSIHFRGHKMAFPGANQPGFE